MSKSASKASAAASLSTLSQPAYRDIVVLGKSQTQAIQRYETAGYAIVDVTSKSTDDAHRRFSPFYPLGGIPVPGYEDSGRTSLSVEGIWQGLKVFETAGVDEALFDNGTMARLKRTTHAHGNVRGHYNGRDETGKLRPLLGVVEARRKIFLPSYLWVLETRLSQEIAKLRTLARSHDIVLLDFMTNGDVEDASSPLSHAHLLREYILTGKVAGAFSSPAVEADAGGESGEPEGGDTE